MARFYKNIILLIVINIGVFYVIVFAIHIFFVEKHWQTDPDVFIIPNNKHYQFVIMGTSHGQIFTRFANQQPVENILGEHFFNLSQPNAGPMIEKIYLQFFLDKGNTSNTLVYFIDPQVFYTDQDNENYTVLPLYGEINVHLLSLLVENHISFPTILSYLKTYISFKWFIKHPRPNLPDQGIYVPNRQTDTSRLRELYPSGTHQSDFKHYEKVIDDIIRMCREHKMHIIFIIPTTRLKVYPGMNQLISLLKKYKKSSDIPYHDYSHAITTDSLYSNVDHLNSAGVRVFTEKYLKNILLLQKIHQ